MSGASDHTSAGRIPMAVLGGILLLAEIPIRLMEYYHFLHGVEAHFPQFYGFLISPTVTAARWIVGVLMIAWVIVEHRRQPATAAAQPIAPQQQINFNPVIQNIQNAPPIVGAVEPAQPAPRPEPQAALAHPGPNLMFLQS